MGATQCSDNGTFIWLRAISVNGEKFTVFTIDGRVHRKTNIVHEELLSSTFPDSNTIDQCRYVSYHGCRTGGEMNRKR